MKAIRYRVGLDKETGKLLVGIAHLRQSLGVIWLTRKDIRYMLLDFGSDLRGHLGEDVTPSLALDLYDTMVTAAHRWEPEYRIRTMQLVHLTRLGSLGVKYGGTYYPEGRLGNYDIAIEDEDGLLALPRAIDTARSVVA